MRFMDPDGFDLAGECDATDPERFKAAVEAVEAPLTEAEIEAQALQMLEKPSSFVASASTEQFRNEAKTRRTTAWDVYWAGRGVGQETIDAEEAAYRALRDRANAARDAILREGIEIVRAYKGRTVELERVREAMNDADYRFRQAAAKVVTDRYWELIRARNAAQERKEIEGLRTEGSLPVPMPVVRDWRRSEHVARRGGTEAVLVLTHDRRKGFQAKLQVRIPAKQSWPVFEVKGEQTPTREGAVDALRRKAREMGVVTDPTHLTV